MEFDKIIKALRDKYGWSQQELAARLNYSASNISRIEAGMLAPPYSVMEYALQLLGENSMEPFTFFLDKYEKFGYDTMKKLDKLHVEKDFAEMKALVEQVKEKKPFTSGLFLQYILLCNAVSNEGLNPEDKLGQLLEAMYITRPDFQPGDVGVCYYSYNEIRIIGEIASVFHSLGDSEKAMQILYSLRENMNRGYMDEKEKARTYPLILCNLSVYLGALERNAEMYEVCVEAKNCAIKNNKMRALPNILATIAHYQFLREDFVGMKDTLLQAYFTARGMEQFAFSNMIADVAKNLYGIDLLEAFSLR